MSTLVTNIHIPGREYQMWFIIYVLCLLRSHAFLFSDRFLKTLPKNIDGFFPFKEIGEIAVLEHEPSAIMESSIESIRSPYSLLWYKYSLEPENGHQYHLIGAFTNKSK